jgi:hypothetical protein
MLQILEIWAELLLGCSQNLQKSASKSGKSCQNALKVPAKMLALCKKFLSKRTMN